MAIGDAHVFLGFLTPVLTQLSFQSTDYFSHMPQFSRSERRNTPERKFASTGYRTHNQVISLTNLTLNHPAGLRRIRLKGSDEWLLNDKDTREPAP